MKHLRTKIRQFLGLKSIVQLKRFLITGGIATLISYLIFIFCIRQLHLHYLLANFVSFIISIIFAYNINKRWSFGGDHQKSSHLLEYLAAYLFTLGLSMIILKITVGIMGIIPEISFFISLCFTTCINFLSIKFLVFKK